MHVQGFAVNSSFVYIFYPNISKGTHPQQIPWGPDQAIFSHFYFSDSVVPTGVNQVKQLT